MEKDNTLVEELQLSTENFKGQAKLFKIKPQYKKSHYIIISIVNDKTCIFPSDKDGNILDYIPLYLSGNSDFDKVLKEIGYKKDTEFGRKIFA